MRPTLRSYLPDLFDLFLLSGLVILADQAFKEWVRLTVSMGGIWNAFLELLPYARVVHWKNYGAAFGMFQNGNMIFAILAVLVSLLIVNFYPTIPRSEWYLRTALALQLGGAVGNLLDRIRLGWVTDWISILDFPVFNLADLSITLGVIFIFLPFVLAARSEYQQIRLRRLANAIGMRRRRKKTQRAALAEEEPLSLGLLELALHRVRRTQLSVLKLEAKRLRHRRMVRLNKKHTH